MVTVVLPTGSNSLTTFTDEGNQPNNNLIAIVEEYEEGELVVVKRGGHGQDIPNYALNTDIVTSQNPKTYG